MFKKILTDALIKILRSIGRYKVEYPKGLKYERRQSFKALIKKHNDAKNDDQNKR